VLGPRTPIYANLGKPKLAVVAWQAKKKSGSGLSQSLNICTVRVGGKIKLGATWGLERAATQGRLGENVAQAFQFAPEVGDAQVRIGGHLSRAGSKPQRDRLVCAGLPTVVATRPIWQGRSGIPTHGAGNADGEGVFEKFFLVSRRGHENSWRSPLVFPGPD